jgi:cytochrome c
MLARCLTTVLGLALSAPAFAAAPATGDAVAGRAAFNKCASCHQVGPNAKSGFGPHLTAIIGRPAAAAKDYTYSEAMKKSGLVWNEKNLTAFIKSPTDTVPGTKMRFWGIGNEKQIADMLAYLRSVQ